MTTRRVQSAPKVWRQSVGERPYTVQLEERTVGGPIRVQARVDGTRAWRPLQTASVLLPTGQSARVGDLRLTRAPNGAPTAESVARLRKAAIDLIVELTGGRNPWATESVSPKAVSAANTVQSDLTLFHPAMTLAELAHAAQHPRLGRFLGNSQSAMSQRWSLKSAMQVALAVLGPELRVSTISVVHLRQIWLARASRPNEDGITGFRATENNVAILLATLSWAGVYCAELAHSLSTRWRAMLRKDWKGLRSVSVDEAQRKEGPRYTPEEMRRILQGIAERKGPPSIRLAADIGGEQRLGQVAEQVQRSNLLLNEGAHGVIIVPESGRKRGGTIHLTASQRQHIDEELRDGIHRHTEPLYLAGVLKNYALIPRLLGDDGAVDPAKAHLPLDKRAAQRQWKQFEARCGVDSVKHRGWYGMRRWASDAIEAAAEAMPGVDPRALAIAQFWEVESNTRRRYQTSVEDELNRTAASLRAKARHHVIESASTTVRDDASS